MPEPRTVQDAARLWDPAGTWCNTASYGLPPTPAVEALQAAVRDWHGGRTTWEPWGVAAEDARAAFARLVGVPAGRVAIGSTTSQAMAALATALPAGARVVVPDVEFTSTLFPFLVQERLDVRTVAPAGLADAVADGADAVAFSAVQMSTGEVCDLDAVLAAAASVGALTLCDGTQACGWLPLDATRVDALVVSAYKWLCCPRGVAFTALTEALQERVVPHAAGWYAAEDVHGSYIGPAMRLAGDARRLDVGPAWLPWIGAAPALELLGAVGVDAIGEHDVALANRFRAGLGLEPSNSAIVSVDAPGAAERLGAAGIVAAVREGRLRASWHLYNDEADVDRVLDALAG